MKTRQGARRTTSAETARTRDVLHAALELFYERFAAAVDVAFAAALFQQAATAPFTSDLRAGVQRPAGGAAST